MSKYIPGVTALQHDLNLFYILCVKVLTVR